MEDELSVDGGEMRPNRSSTVVGSASNKPTWPTKLDPKLQRNNTKTSQQGRDLDTCITSV